MRFYLAPLAEFTDAPFRRMCIEGGADRTYTEMVSAAALFHGHGPTRHLMEKMDGEGETVCQIFGSNEIEVAFAAREIEKLRKRFAGIDLNAGCPMPRIVAAGAGAALAKNPALAGRLLKAIKENTSLPVSAKTRLGPRRGEKTVFEFVDAAREAGVSEIAIHARYTSQMHGGIPDMETLAEAAARAGVDVIGNGSVKTRADVEAFAATGVKAVMIGRAALPDPFIFGKLKGEYVAPHSATELALKHLRYALEFRRALSERFPGDKVPGEDGWASVKMHLHLFRYFNGLAGAAKLRARLSSIRTLEETLREIRGFGV